MSVPAQPLARRLGLGGAVSIGLGSMIGAGVFSAFAPAAQSAGSGLLIALLIAAAVAACNATSSAQLAAIYPRSGGTYVYGREQLGPWCGFIAGWSFLIGKTASCAAMAMTFAAYVAPDGWEKGAAIAGVLGIASLNLLGVTRTARGSMFIVAMVLVALGIVIVSGLSLGPDHLEWIMPTGEGSAGYGVLQAAGLLFFAFAGYARIATMGEEVKDPGRNIPRAIIIALTAAVLVYTAVAIVALGVLGPARLAVSDEPLADVVVASGWAWAVPLVQWGGAAAALGSLLALMAGIGRTSLAMAREADLPRSLAAVHPRFQVPHRAEGILAITVCALVLMVDLRGAIGFSSFGVLLYYFIANLAAYSQPADVRRYPRAVQVAGMAGCALLVLTLPLPNVIGGVAVVAIGIVGRLGARRFTRRGP